MVTLEELVAVSEIRTSDALCTMTSSKKGRCNHVKGLLGFVYPASNEQEPGTRYSLNLRKVKSTLSAEEVVLI
jgi:hypothetical protein